MVLRMESNKTPVAYGLAGSCTSERWVEAFSQGCGGKVSYNNVMLPNHPVAMFGDPTLHTLLGHARDQGRDWYYGDHAYFRRRVYYRITKNAWQHDTRGEAHPARWERLGIKIEPWRKHGEKILLCPQSSRFFELHGLNHTQWVRDTMEVLHRYTDRPIEIRYKSDGLQTEEHFWQSLHDAYAVVVYTSVAGVQAAIHGVPCFATHECASKYFGTDDLSKIESPVRPDDRERMAWVLANNQWTMEEIAQGLAWEHIR
jgi:hypothetical protein